MNNWTPADIRKIIVQILGICLAIGGVYLIVSGVKTDGTTIIKFNVKEFSTELHTGQAGIALIFLGIVLVIVPLFSFKKKSSTSLAHPLKVLLIKSGISLSLLVVTVLLVLLLRYFNLPDIGVALITLFLAIIDAGVIIAIFSSDEFFNTNSD